MTSSAGPYNPIDVGIGYAVWVGIGAVIASAFFFDEPVTFTRVFWLGLIIAGVIWLKVADSPKLASREPRAAETAQAPKAH
ncbi:DMT family transporter [Nesterenkonia aurantiaca]|uniref:DMT family transporter n=1 Tax=Nesterenkonia aurantiaca TaxID=1436010 RepID=UPI003EE5BBB8